MTHLVLLLAGVFVLSAMLTFIVWRFAGALSLLDEPNARSMHRTPTARGGGVAIVVSFVSGVVVLASRGDVPWSVVLALLSAGVPVAVVGMWDDVRELPPMFRLIVHFMAAMALVVGLGGVPAVLATGAPELVEAGLLIVLVVACVWLLNLYNFMDGTDGFATSQAIFVSLGATLLCSFDPAFVGIPLVLAASALGFLLFNWPPARIFMGDVASGFIGLMLAGMALHFVHNGVLGICVWLLLLGTFVVDATVTLIHRGRRGQRVYVGHREHAYQHLASRIGHLKTVLFYQAINVFVLLPLAWLVNQMPHLGVPVTAACYLALAGLMAWLGAGSAADTSP